MTDRPNMTGPLLIEAGAVDTGPFRSSDGQGLGVLAGEPVAQANAPSLRNRVDTAFLCRYTGTDFVQWHGRAASGYYHPIGRVMLLTDAGKARLAARDERP